MSTSPSSNSVALEATGELHRSEVKIINNDSGAEGGDSLLEGLPIRHLILETSEYVVFIDHNLDLDWKTTEAYDKVGHKDQQRHNEVVNDAALLEATPCAGLSDEVKLHFKRLIGEGIARSLGHDYVSARKMLASAQDYIGARSQETSRFWYLSASIATTVPLVSAGVAVWVWRGAIVPLVGQGFFWIFLASVAGAVGALFSVIARTGRQTFDCASGWRLHYLEAGSRILTGMISGLLVALAVKLEFILAPIARGEKASIAMLLAALVSGTGERLASSIISSIESTREKPSKDRPSTQSKERRDGA